MWVDLSLLGEVNANGILEGISFGDAKKKFRGFLDSTFDHHLLLNQDDPWAKPVFVDNDNPRAEHLPGLMTFEGDPTTENLARWIAEWAVGEFQLSAEVTVHETSVNAASHFITVK